jgi:hypothetical protein
MSQVLSETATLEDYGSTPRRIACQCWSQQFGCRPLRRYMPGNRRSNLLHTLHIRLQDHLPPFRSQNTHMVRSVRLKHQTLLWTLPQRLLAHRTLEPPVSRQRPFRHRRFPHVWTRIHGCCTSLVRLLSTPTSYQMNSKIAKQYEW